MNIDYLNRVGTAHNNFKTHEMRLNEENQNLKKKIERLNNVIKEVRELRKQLSYQYYENGLEVGVNVVIEDLDKILDKENK